MIRYVHHVKREDEVADRIAEKIEEINQLAVEAVRGGGVAGEKRKGWRLSQLNPYGCFVRHLVAS